VMNPANVALVQDIVRRESLSLLNYVGDAFPWTTSAGSAKLARLQDVVRAHREAVAEAGQFLTKKRTPVGYIGSYPANFTAINFLSLDYILPRLAAAEANGVARLEREAASLTDPEAVAMVQHLLSVKRDHLKTLEGLAAEHEKPLAG
jgi:rubrerythrin